MAIGRDGASSKRDFLFGMTEPASGEVMDLQAGVYRSFPGTLADATADAQTNDYMERYRIRTHIGKGAIDIQTVGGIPGVKINGLYGMSLSGETRAFSHGCLYPQIRES